MEKNTTSFESWLDWILWTKAFSELSKGIFNLFGGQNFSRCSGRDRFDSRYKPIEPTKNFR